MNVLVYVYNIKTSGVSGGRGGWVRAIGYLSWFMCNPWPFMFRQRIPAVQHATPTTHTHYTRVYFGYVCIRCTDGPTYVCIVYNALYIQIKAATEHPHRLLSQGLSHSFNPHDDSVGNRKLSSCTYLLVMSWYGSLLMCVCGVSIWGLIGEFVHYLRVYVIGDVMQGGYFAFLIGQCAVSHCGRCVELGYIFMLGKSIWRFEECLFDSVVRYRMFYGKCGFLHGC